MNCKSALLIAVLLAPLLLAGCSSSVLSLGPSHQERLYLDGNLGFAMEIPHTWSRCAIPALDNPGKHAAVRWDWPGGGEDDPPARVTVFTMLPPEAKGGFATLEAEFLHRHPSFTLTAREEFEAAGAPARQIIGHTPSHTFLVILITSNRRAVTLEMSTPPEFFDQYRSFFEEIIQSFRIL